MALVKCRDCRTDVSDSAERCVNCGAEYPGARKKECDACDGSGKCGNCDGTGSFAREPCEECGGYINHHIEPGSLNEDLRVNYGTGVCRSCNGRGFRYYTPCAVMKRHCPAPFCRPLRANIPTPALAGSSCSLWLYLPSLASASGFRSAPL